MYENSTGIECRSCVSRVLCISSEDEDVMLLSQSKARVVTKSATFRNTEQIANSMVLWPYPEAPCRSSLGDVT